jgi:hypothetical protein
VARRGQEIDGRQERGGEGARERVREHAKEGRRLKLFYTRSLLFCALCPNQKGIRKGSDCKCQLALKADEDSASVKLPMLLDADSQFDGESARVGRNAPRFLASLLAYPDFLRSSKFLLPKDLQRNPWVEPSYLIPSGHTSNFVRGLDIPFRAARQKATF